jgi:hypothetical protein
MLNNEFTQREKNLYEQFNLTRGQFTDEDVNQNFDNLKAQHGHNFSADDIKVVVSKIQTFLNEEKLKFYEAVGTIYTSEQDKNDSDYGYVLERETITGAFTKAVTFYLVSFVIFAIVFAAKQFNVLKSVLVISMVFWYLEFQITFNRDFEHFIESWIPITAGFAAFEKIVFVRSIFQLSIQIANGITRVLVDAEVQFIRDDKAKFFKIMLMETKKVSEIVVEWDDASYLKNELDEIKKNQEAAKLQKSTWCQTIMKWIFILLLVRVSYTFTSGFYEGVKGGLGADGQNSDL